MAQIDLVSLWRIYWRVFTLWFSALAFLANLLFVHFWTRLSQSRVIFAATAITVSSWLLVGEVPIPLFVSIAAIRSAYGGYSILALIVPVVLSSITAALLGILVLRFFHQRAPLWRLVTFDLICVGIAFWRTIFFAIAHPPIA
jgi:hypothetical protein